MKIIGAGLAGLLSGNILRQFQPIILERQTSLPNNHSALLRFRTDTVSKATGIPFKTVTVTKDIFESRGPIKDANGYSLKVVGEIGQRSIIDTKPATRYIAPSDLINQMALNLHIEYDMNGPWPVGEPIVSTIPMPDLMAILEWSGKTPDFTWQKGWTARGRIKNCDVYQTVYCPHSMPFYRASITGNELILEYARPPVDHMLDARYCLEDCFGIDSGHLEPEVKFSHTKYGKIAPIDERTRKEFIAWATTTHNIWSIGRFAIWKPGLLLDDVVGDIMKIDRWIRQGDYDRRKDQ